jgi:hypothetical protein
MRGEGGGGQRNSGAYHHPLSSLSVSLNPIKFTKFLIEEKVLPKSAESWLVYKADDEQKFMLQKFYQSLSEQM